MTDKFQIQSNIFYILLIKNGDFMESIKEKWFIDTDIGNDSDDCMALGYLLARKDIEILGITTVSGECRERAAFADLIVSGTGKRIPVCPGNEKSLSGECIQYCMEAHQREQIYRYPSLNTEIENRAVNLLKKTIEANPYEISLAIIGQMTNIALLFATYPHIPKLLKKIVIMGGRYFDKDYCDIKKWGFTEWNIKLDPYAASIVFQNIAAESYITGVEISCQFFKKAQNVADKLSSVTYMKSVCDVIRNYDITWFHDAIAIWAGIYKEKLKWVQGNIRVEINNPEEIKTVFSPDPHGKCFVLSEMNSDNFFEDFAKNFGFDWNN